MSTIFQKSRSAKYVFVAIFIAPTVSGIWYWYPVSTSWYLVPESGILVSVSDILYLAVEARHQVGRYLQIARPLQESADMQDLPECPENVI